MGLGLRLKEILKSKNMTIKELSQESEVSINTLYSITKRDNNMARYDIVEKIALALGVSVEELTGYTINHNIANNIKNPRLYEVIQSDSSNFNNKRSFADLVMEVANDTLAYEKETNIKKEIDSDSTKDDKETFCTTPKITELRNCSLSQEGLDVLAQLTNGLKESARVSVEAGRELLLSFVKLNEKGQTKAIEQVEMLTKIPEYQKNNGDPEQE